MSTSLSRRSSTTAHPTRQQLEELDALLKRMLDLPVHRLDDETEAEEPPTQANTPQDQTAFSPQEPLRGPHRASLARDDSAAAVNYQTDEEDEADLKPRIVCADSGAQDAEEPAAETPVAQPVTNAAQPGDKEDWVPLTSTWKPSARTWKPLSEAWQQAKAGGQPASAPAAVQKDAVVATPAPAPSSKQSATPDEAPPTVVEASLPVAPAASPASLRSEDVASAPPAPSAPPGVGTPWFLWPLVLFNILFDAFLMPWGAPGRWLRGPAGRWLLAVVGMLCLAAAGALTAADWFGWTW